MKTRRFKIRAAVGCKRCDLCKMRDQVVFGDGNPKPGIMMIGEGPGGDEDEKGYSFVGRAGRRLMKWLSSIGLERGEDFYLTNLVKCRPPKNRDPRPEEIEACSYILRKELARVQPWLVIPIGAFASKVVLQDNNFSIMKYSGTLFPRMLDHLDYHTDDYVMVFPILHPSFILRPNGAKHEYRVLDDLEWLRDNVLQEEEEAA